MKWLVGWGIVFVLSWGLGAIVCGVTLFMKKYKTTMIAAFVFFGLPLLGLGADLINQKRILYNFERAKEEVARLCAKDGGDKIYRAVENVQGVFQMRARLPDYPRNPDGTFYNAMSDQYGMEDPYGRAMGDKSELSSEVGMSSIRPETPPRGKHGYWFIEQLPRRASPEGSGYRRSYWSVVENPPEWKVRAKGGKPMYEVKKMSNVSKLLSRYGYLTEDLTTTEMRDNWIGAGRIKIIDLQTTEVLAERRGYFRASGDLLPPGADRWTASGAGSQGRICPEGSVWSFLHAVLKPPADFPKAEQLESIARELNDHGERKN
jgi:hypothetical protein